MDVQKYRALFPVTKQYVFLNNAAESPLNEPFRMRLEDYLKVCSTAPQDKPSTVREEVRTRLAKLLGGAPHEYALVTSTGVGVSIVAAGYPWKKGDNIVVPADEHWNNTFPWLALREKEVEVRIVPVDEHYRISPEAVAERVDQNTKIVAAAAVRFNSGFRSNLKALSQIAHQVGALFLVDGIQATGVMPLNIEEEGMDILCCAGFKWLLGMPGTGFLYVKQDVQHQINPSMPGMFAAENIFTDLHYYEDARRFETGSIAYSLFHAWTAGLDVLLEVGVERIYDRVVHLTGLLIQGIRAKGYTLLSPVETLGERSSILIFSVGDANDNKALYASLRQKGIIVTYRAGAIRVSPSFFNTEEEIAAFLSAI